MTKLNKLHAFAITGALLAALIATGCDRREDSSTIGQKVDAAIANADQKADAAKADVKQAAQQAKESAGEVMADAKRAASEAARSAATAVSDAAITADIKAKLAADAELKASDVSVETNAGHVALRGTAPDASSRARATQLAATVKGVIAVDNRITVERKSS